MLAAGESTLDEDSKRTRGIAQTIVRRLIRIQDEIQASLWYSASDDDDVVESLCGILGMWV